MLAISRTSPLLSFSLEKKAKSTIGKQRVFKPFIIEKHTRVADKGSQTGAWITPVSHQGTQCQPSCTESSTQTVLG